ncbi:hypothetical protein DSM43518_02988 [Mycobacterium marinum]|nr:hypothetical protein DSM43518_02988 [Mycobacterium marinum]
MLPEPTLAPPILPLPTLPEPILPKPRLNRACPVTSRKNPASSLPALPTPETCAGTPRPVLNAPETVSPRLAKPDCSAQRAHILHPRDAGPNIEKARSTRAKIAKPRYGALAQIEKARRRVGRRVPETWRRRDIEERQPDRSHVLTGVDVYRARWTADDSGQGGTGNHDRRDRDRACIDRYSKETGIEYRDGHRMNDGVGAGHGDWYGQRYCALDVGGDFGNGDAVGNIG